MTDQLPLFEVEESKAPSDPIGARKTCSICKEEFYVPEGSHRGAPYCKPCRSKYNAAMHILRKNNPVPDNPSCECCGKSAEDLTIYYDGSNNPISPWRLDHCHESGEFRGWVCNNCNVGLGRFYDDVGLLEKAIDYIQKNRP